MGWDAVPSARRPTLDMLTMLSCTVIYETCRYSTRFLDKIRHIDIFRKFPQQQRDRVVRWRHVIMDQAFVYASSADIQLMHNLLMC